jgi:flagellar biosynthesis/type III secretory pathway protein FliH
MSYVALFAGWDTSIATTQRVFRPSQLQALADVDELLAALQERHATSAARAAAAAERARADGHAEGFAHGERAAREALARHLTQIEAIAQRERAVLRAQVESCIASLALEIVRKLAGELDAAELVTRLAHQAAAQLLDEEPATLVVHPDLATAVRARCARCADAGGPALAVQEDAELDRFGCRLVTRAGTTLAGLETQLRRIERAWSDVEGTP